MTPAQVPSMLAALAVAVVGLLVAIRPDGVGLAGIQATSALGRTEIRSVFGGMFLAMGVTCLVTQHPYAYLTAGAMWLGDAVVRVFALFADRPKPAEGLTVLGIGTLVGLMLVSGFFVR